MLLLAVVSAAIVVLLDWRLALAGVLLIHLGVSSTLVLVHQTPGVVAAGQMLAIVLAVAILGLAGILQGRSLAVRHSGNWLLRLTALVLIVGAWWFLDPGYTLPSFTQPQTDLLLWAAICGLAVWSFSASALFSGVAILLWSTPLYAISAVLLPGSGLPALIGITDLLLALACGYLVLLEPSAAKGKAQRVVAPQPAARAERPRQVQRETQPPRQVGNGTRGTEPLQEKAA